jgi:sugar lactone lactonase YvrE
MFVPLSAARTCVRRVSTGLVTLLAAGLLTGATVLGAASATAAAGPSPGTVFIADRFASQILALPPGGGSPTPTGPTLVTPTGVAVDKRGDVYVAASAQAVVIPASGAPPTTLGTGLSDASGIAIDPTGNVFIADRSHNRIVEVPAGGGPQTTVGTGLKLPTGVTVDVAGNLYVADSGNDRVVKIPAGGGSQTTVATGLNTPTGVTVDIAGNVYVADYGNDRVIKIPAGGGSQATIGITGLGTPAGVALDAAGDLFIADIANGNVVRVPAGGGAQSIVASGLLRPFGVAVFAPPPTFTADSPPRSATVGSAYKYTYRAPALSGEPPARFSLAQGALPPGLTLDPGTGILSGRPTRAGAYSFRVLAANAVNAALGPRTTITVAKAARPAPTGSAQLPRARAESDGLPATGTSAVPMSGLAVALVLAGLGLILLTRHRPQARYPVRASPRSGRSRGSVRESHNIRDLP